MSDLPPQDRKMNDTTMPPPRHSNTDGAAAGATATTATAAVAGPSRRKIPTRAPGFGLSDWHRLVHSSKDLALRHGAPLRKIRWTEIKQHTSIQDGWVVLKNKVYYISPYLAYHPGGKDVLKKVLGKDVTSLYEKYHRWVNEENLVGKLLIGYLDTEPDSDEEDDSSPLYVMPGSVDGFAMPAPRPPTAKK